MKRLLLLLAMVAVGAGALHSNHKRNLYIQAALLSEAFTLIAPVKRQVSDHYVQNGVMPHDNADAGMPPAHSIFGASVKRVAINRGGVLLVDFEEEIGKTALTFSPTINANTGLLNWQCTSDSIDPNVLDKLKPSCAYLQSTAESRLMHAIANRSVSEVKRIITSGAKPDAVVNGNTPLMLAAKIGDLDIVTELLGAGASVDNNAVNAERRTPLMVAITSDNADVATVLLSKGASTTRKDYRGMTAHDHAVETDRRLSGERYVLMVAARLNPNFAGHLTGKTVARPKADKIDHQALYSQLRRAAKDCNAYRLSSLLQDQNDLGSYMEIGGKPLTDHRVKPECSSALLEFLNTRKSYQYALNARFAEAMTSCDSRRVENTMDANPTLDVFRKFNDTSHFSKAVMSGCADVLAMITRKIDVAKGVEGDTLITALRYAPRNNLVELIGVLINAGVAIDTVDRNGDTALSLAIALEQPVVAKFLVDAGADVNLPTGNNSYPIIEASKKGLEHLVGQFIQLGADVNQQDQLGRTALLAAVARGQNRIVDKLLKEGADALLEDRDGISAVTLAESKNLGHIHSLLTASSDF